MAVNNEKLSSAQERISDLISIIRVLSCRISGFRKYKRAIKEDIEASVSKNWKNSFGIRKENSPENIGIR